MIKITITVPTSNGSQTKTLGIDFQHHRGYKEREPKKSVVAGFKAGVLEVQDGQTVPTQKAVVPSKTRMKTLMQKAFKGPETGSGTICRIYDLTGVEDGQFDYKTATPLHFASTQLSKEDGFQAGKGRSHSFNRAVKGWYRVLPADPKKKQEVKTMLGPIPSDYHVVETIWEPLSDVLDIEVGKERDFGLTFFQAFWEARQLQLAVAWTDDAIRNGVITADERDSHLNKKLIEAAKCFRV